jgi:PleD family two-component response regulator
MLFKVTTKMNNSAAFLPLTQHQDERKKRIMTVDDEKDVIFCLSKVLQETGLFDVDGFTDSQYAYLVSNKVSMILLF